MLFRVNAFTASLATCLFVLGGSLHAQQLEFSDDGGATFSTQFDANVGDTTTVEVFLNDPQASPDFSLTAFGFDVQHDIGVGNIAGGITANSGFENDLDSGTSAGGAFIVQSTDITPLPSGPSIPLASFEFISTGAGVTNFTLSDTAPTPGILGAQFLSGDLELLDAVIFGANPGFSIVSAIAVPEPSSGLLLVAACSSFLLRRKRRQ